MVLWKIMDGIFIKNHKFDLNNCNHQIIFIQIWFNYNQFIFHSILIKLKGKKYFLHKSCHNKKIKCKIASIRKIIIQLQINLDSNHNLFHYIFSIFAIKQTINIKCHINMKCVQYSIDKHVAIPVQYECHDAEELLLNKINWCHQ